SRLDSGKFNIFRFVRWVEPPGRRVARRDDGLRASPDDASRRWENHEAPLWPATFETPAVRAPGGRIRNSGLTPATPLVEGGCAVAPCVGLAQHRDMHDHPATKLRDGSQAKMP